jgi:uncharacterized protein involved in propanediol utilization
MQALTRQTAALGVVVSHTGPAIGLILPPDSDLQVTDALTALSLENVLNYRLTAG